MSDNRTKNCEKFTLIRNRLRLAKSLLEESDKLSGAEAYGAIRLDNVLPHERHERESVVIYLLLTCLDLLGQAEKHLSFSNWLNSNKEKYVSQREAVISELGQCVDPVEASKALLNVHSKIYGVTNSFFRGINYLSEEARHYLFSSISVSDLESNVEGSQNELIIDGGAEENETRLKMKYLFSLRNSFTHALAQHHISSAPMMSIFGNEIHPSLAEQPRASWGFFVDEDKVIPWGINEQKQGRYLYKVSDLVFILFELLHSVIEEPFNRDDININFFIFSSTGKFFPSVPSRNIDDCLKLNFGVTRPRWKN